VTRASTQARLNQALTRLLAGQPTATDGELTIANLCREAGVGRDSFYRSPQAFKDTVAAAQANREARQPELVALREEIAALKRARKQTAREHAATVRELEETVRVYANQIQVLALRNPELVTRPGNCAAAWLAPIPR
jgi:hypothetical protein